jgi:hypothetical protein
MSKAFATVLAKKVSGEVLEVVGVVKNYLKAKVAFPLEEPLKPTVEARIKDKGIM